MTSGYLFVPVGTSLQNLAKSRRLKTSLNPLSLLLTCRTKILQSCLRLLSISSQINFIHCPQLEDKLFTICTTDMLLQNIMTLVLTNLGLSPQAKTPAQRANNSRNSMLGLNSLTKFSSHLPNNQRFPKIVQILKLHLH